MCWRHNTDILSTLLPLCVRKQWIFLTSHSFCGYVLALTKYFGRCRYCQDATKDEVQRVLKVLRCHKCQTCVIMTSSNGNIFRVTGFWWGESGVFRSQRPVTWSFDGFLYLRLSNCLSNQWKHRWFEKPSRLLWRHCNGIRRARGYSGWKDVPWRRAAGWAQSFGQMTLWPEIMKSLSPQLRCLTTTGIITGSTKTFLSLYVISFK